MFKKAKIALCAFSAIAIVSAAVAAEYKFNGEGNEGKTFWTVFTNSVNGVNQSNYGSIFVTNSNDRGFTLNWDNKDVDAADFASGGGWNNVARPTTVKYSIGSWAIERAGSGGAFGIYGWSCTDFDTTTDNVEFYIVDAWLGTAAEYTPYDNFRQPDSRGRQVQVSTSHGTYKIWQSPSYNRANACTNGKKFHQVWAIRTAKRSVGTTEVSVEFKKISEVMDDYGYFTSNLRYLVVGIDAFRNTKGKISVNTVNKS